MSELNGLIRRHAKIVVIGLAGLGMTLTSAFAADNACDGVKVEVTKARKQEYAALVVSAMENKFKPSQAKFITIMESGKWSAAYVSTPVSDDGVMFFQTVNGAGGSSGCRLRSSARLGKPRAAPCLCQRAARAGRPSPPTRAPPAFRSGLYRMVRA
jgi:hypothetical protein